MATLDELMGKITWIANRGVDLLDPAGAMQAAHTALLTQLVVEVTKLIESAAAAQVASDVAQPAVAETPAAVAAPVDPAATPASDSASSTPEAAGAAPIQPPQV